ncbi:MAG: hypothetical protein AAGC55_30725, partial [Myxococcota bacterium]
MICCLLAAGVASAEPAPVSVPDGEPAPVAAEDSEYVLIRSGTSLYAAPDRAAFAVPVGSRDRRSMGDLGRSIHVLRFVAERGDWVEVAPARSGIHCYYRRPATQLDMRWYVPRQAMLPVLVGEVAIEPGDGTSLKVAPGVWAEPRRRGRYRVRTPYLSVDLALTADQVGVRYRDQPRYGVHRVEHFMAGPTRLRIS